MMPRVPEPELMDDAEQARAYAEADFSEPNRVFVECFGRCFPEEFRGRMLDLGCGPGDISLRLARRYPGARVDALDGAPAMLDLARGALAAEPVLGERLRFIKGRLPAVVPPEPRYEALVSNSLLHHLHEPVAFWRFIWHHAAPGAAVLVMDLMRPVSEQAARGLVSRYAAEAPPVLREDYYNSLLAAFTPEEVGAQLQGAGLYTLQVEQVSDRHMLIWGRLPH